MASFLLILPHSLFLRALGLGKVSSHAVSRPMERPMWQGINVSGLCKRVPEACQWMSLKVDLPSPANAMLVHLEVHPLPFRPWNNPSPADNLISVLWESLGKRHIATPPWFITHRDCEIVKISCFRLLCFVIICYRAIDNEHVLYFPI